MKADQVPLLAAGVAFYVLLALFPAIIAGVSIYGLVADPQTVRDQINQLAQTLSPETAKLIGTLVLLAVLLLAGLAALYRYAPDRDKPKWSWSSPGSVVATVLWVLASVGFSIYVNAFGNYNKTYGALAGIIILMFWLYLTAFVVLVGAELNAEMELQTTKDTTAGPEQPLGERDAQAADHLAEAPT